MGQRGTTTPEAVALHHFLRHHHSSGFRNVSFDTKAGQGSLISWKDPEPPWGIIGSLHSGDGACLVSVGTGRMAWQHSKLFTCYKAHVSPFTEASAEMFSEKLETSQLPTHLGVTL